MNFNEYIHGIIKTGKCCFSIEDAKQTMKKTRKAVLSSIEHLLARGELVSPAKGFYVIVPPEYQILGCIPAEYFIPYLMEYWGCDYYACLLTAAKYHGASHQAVMVFQVMIEGRKSPISCGKVKVRFIRNRNLKNSFIQSIPTKMSMLNVSTPESTAIDMMNYLDQSGGLNQIATVLSELHENMKPDKLQLLVKKNSTLAWKQRLGYVLEMLGADELANVLKENLAKEKRVDYIPLTTGLKKNKKAKKNETWKIIENTTIESDL